jgi:hypothetical protein
MYEFMSNKIKESPEYKALTDTPPQSQFDGNNNLAEAQDTTDYSNNEPPFNPTDDIPF